MGFEALVRFDHPTLDRTKETGAWRRSLLIAVSEGYRQVLKPCQTVGVVECVDERHLMREGHYIIV